MKSSLYSDEIQGVALDEIKSVCYNPAKQDFIAKAISSTNGGFHPSQTDLTARYSVKSTTLRRGWRIWRALGGKVNHLPISASTKLDKIWAFWSKK